MAMGHNVASELEHDLLGQLERTGCHLRARARAIAATITDPQLRGVVISDGEFDQLLGKPLGATSLTSLPAAQNATDKGHWGRFTRQFALSPLEQQVLLICLLPEVDLSYERIFCYLQDNVTARRPTVALLLQLTCNSLADCLAARRLFWPEASLLRWGLLGLHAEERDDPLATQRVAVNPVAVEHLLNPQDPPQPAHPAIKLCGRDERLAPSTPATAAITAWLDRQQPRCLWVQLEARYPELAEQLAAAACHAWQMPLVELDLGLTDDVENAARAATLEAMLRGGALLITGLGDDRPDASHRALAERVAQALAHVTTPVFWHGALQLPLGAPMHVQTAAWPLPAPDYEQRFSLWRNALPDGAQADTTTLQTVAARYRLSPEQIAWAGRAASAAAAQRGDAAAAIRFADLAASARRVSNRDIGQLARRLEPHHGWDDLVLPTDRLAQLREMCDQLTYRHVVMEQWGYGPGNAAPGLSALFAGPSGTGKTMAAEVIAAELGLDLYKIDLSGVVSKYIGETEKNLERIFTLARDANAILLFDEADALFGKRSETRDAHDRYANIEVSYLLQKIEEYDGLVILTSNLRQNLDEAFMRRLQLSVDFPFPDEQARLHIWRRLITPQTPVGELDLELLARRFRLSGGSIRNVILTAAFLAARDGEPLSTDYMIWAIRREYQKLGRLVEAGQFGDGERGAGQRFAQPSHRGWGDA